jgi:putative transposase
MPRLARLDAPGVLHHVMGRGIERRRIFLNATDREDFVSRLAALAEAEAIEIFAWALLPNHFHLLCKSKGRSLAWSMRRLLTGYVVNFNKRHKRHGHLFQNRYKSIVCEEDSYLMELVRYIHLNPLRAGVVHDLDGLNRSRWSGHSAVMGKVKRPWQETRYVLSFFGREASARKKYLRFVEEGVDQGRRPELVGGGLIRSLGGWAEVLGLRSRRERQAADQRVLGSGEFVQRVISEADEFGSENLRLNRRRMELSELAGEVCRERAIGLGELRSGSRRHEVVEARRVLGWLGVKKWGYSGAEVARFLGVTTSCITRSLSAEAARDWEEGT